MSAEEQVRWGRAYIQAAYGGAGATLMYGDGPGGQVSTSTNLVRAHDGTWVTPDHLCPDILRYENIGAADGLRGRVVRAFFWLLRAWPP